MTKMIKSHHRLACYPLILFYFLALIRNSASLEIAETTEKHNKRLRNEKRRKLYNHKRNDQRFRVNDGKTLSQDNFNIQPRADHRELTVSYTHIVFGTSITHMNQAQIDGFNTMIEDYARGEGAPDSLTTECNVTSQGSIRIRRKRPRPGRKRKRRQKKTSKRRELIKINYSDNKSIIDDRNLQECQAGNNASMTLSFNITWDTSDEDDLECYRLNHENWMNSQVGRDSTIQSLKDLGVCVNSVKNFNAVAESSSFPTTCVITESPSLSPTINGYTKAPSMTHKPSMVTTDQTVSYSFTSTLHPTILTSRNETASLAPTDLKKSGSFAPTTLINSTTTFEPTHVNNSTTTFEPTHINNYTLNPTHYSTAPISINMSQTIEPTNIANNNTFAPTKEDIDTGSSSFTFSSSFTLLPTNENNSTLIPTSTSTANSTSPDNQNSESISESITGSFSASISESFSETLPPK